MVHSVKAGHPRLAGIPAVSASEMREIDRLAIDSFGIQLAQMMELAGVALAETAGQLLGTSSDDARVIALVGPGHNGGGGLVAARHLANRGRRVRVILSRPVGQLRAVLRERVATLLEMRVPVCVSPWDLADGELDAALTQADLVVDALLGYSAKGIPRGEVGRLIERAAMSGPRVLSLDLPSGIDPDTGEDAGFAINATATMAIALPKLGLLTELGRRHAGQIFVADIGLPSALFGRIGIEFTDPFAAGSPVRLA